MSGAAGKLGDHETDTCKSDCLVEVHFIHSQKPTGRTDQIGSVCSDVDLPRVFSMNFRL